MAFRAQKKTAEAVLRDSIAQRDLRSNIFAVAGSMDSSNIAVDIRNSRKFFFIFHYLFLLWNRFRVPLVFFILVVLYRAAPICASANVYGIHNRRMIFLCNITNFVFLTRLHGKMNPISEPAIVCVTGVSIRSVFFIHIFFQRDPGVGDLPRGLFADVAEVPRLVDDAGDVGRAVRIAHDKAVLGAVRAQPLELGPSSSS